MKFHCQMGRNFENKEDGFFVEYLSHRPVMKNSLVAVTMKILLNRWWGYAD